jgi:hypothetical protein
MHLDVLEVGKSVLPGTVEASIGHTPLLRLRLLDTDLNEGSSGFREGRTPESERVG